MSTVDFAALIALCAALASAIGDVIREAATMAAFAGHDVALRDEAVSNR